MVTSTTVAEEEASTVADRVSATAAKVKDKLRSGSDAVAERVRPKIDAVTTYVRDEPTKAMLMSAAAGAALMGLIALLARPSRSPGQQFRASAMATIRDAALDLAEQAQTAAAETMAAAKKQAQSTIDDAKKKARRTFDSAQQTAASMASDAADQASSKAADAWQSLRDQAGPMVEKIKPQIDAAMNYAKEDPARAALGVATIGAVLVGLMSLIGRSDD